MNCKCKSLTHKLVGDGCEICNPTKALEYAKYEIQDLKSDKKEAMRLLRCVLGFETISYVRRNEILRYLEDNDD